jgi:predicted MPP superfamily phosphohydrolase
MGRRTFLALGTTALATGLVAGAFRLRASNESDELSLERVSIPLRGLAPALEGFRIAQLSDIHLGSTTSVELVRQSVETANGLQPDLTVLTGDYVWHNAASIHKLAPILAELEAPYGVYACRGNHELWTDPDVTDAALQQVGVQMLVNQGTALSVGNATLYLAGLDDGWSGQPDLEAAMKGVPHGAPAILLYHEPDLADQASLDDRVSLQLAGHSHGGQVRFPGKGALILPYLGRKYDMGLYRVRDMWLYTSRGIGVTSMPFRYNCPPEVTEFTLVLDQG